MMLRIIARSSDGKRAYAEEVTEVKPIIPNHLSLLKKPVQYIDRNSHLWHCEESDIVTSCDGLKIYPAIFKGVYRLEY